jgi:hypothetical protein
LVNVADVMDPTLPDSPLPVLSVAFIDELQIVGSGFPARVPVLSVIPALTDDAVTAPPGLTVQVAAAKAGAALTLRASEAAAIVTAL